MKTVGWVCVGLIGVCALAAGQVEVAQKDEVPPYNVDAISFASGTSKQSRLDLFIQNDVLFFHPFDDGGIATHRTGNDV
ncbi:MAG: hypothetical protein AAB393_10835 [Bacteroidota bacterium]